MALGDFIMAPKPFPRPVPHRTSPAAKAAWGGASQAGASSELRAKAFVDIQDQEIDRKLRQDKAVGMGDGNSRKWFVAQRERAASIQEIQKSD